jgi:hypothetical protein
LVVVAPIFLSDELPPTPPPILLFVPALYVPILQTHITYEILKKDSLDKIDKALAGYKFGCFAPYTKKSYITWAKPKPISIYIIIISVFAIEYNLPDPKTEIFIITLNEIDRLIKDKSILIEFSIINNNSIDLKKTL